MAEKRKKKKRKVKRDIRRAACLSHRIAISLHAEAARLHERTAFLVHALDELFGIESIK